jgi:hypothetical protein
MPHDLRQPVKWHFLCHPIPKTVPQVMGAQISNTGSLRILVNDKPQSTRGEM